MSNKDTAAIMRTMDSSVAFRSLLRSSTSSSSSSSSKYVPPILSAITATPASCPAGTAAAAASAAGRGGEGQDQCRVPIPVPTPTSVGALSRLQVGLAIRLAGEHYPYALYLAAAQELLDRLISMRSISSSCDGDDNADAVGSVVAGRSAAVIKEEGVYEKIISNLQVLGAIQTKTVEEEGDAKSDLSGPLDALAPTMPEFSLDESTKVAYEKELSVVLGAVETLLKSIQVMKAENSWAESASFSGHALMQAFPGAPKGPIISQVSIYCWYVLHHVRFSASCISFNFLLFYFIVILDERLSN